MEAAHDVVSEPPAPRTRLHELDGLRAIAIALVVVHHSLSSAAVAVLSAIGLQRAGGALAFITMSGVELFFVLSGIVLLRPYMRGERRLNVRQYFRRRVTRLWPPYLAAWLFGGGVIVLVTVLPSWYSRQILPPFDLAHWLKQIGIVTLGWWPYNVAWWSLTPEVIFYVLAPVVTLIFSVGRAGRGAFLATTAATVLLSIALWDPVTSAPGVFHGFRVLLLFIAYSPCFLAGSVLARYEPTPGVGRVLLIGGVVYFLLALWIPRVNIHIAFAALYAGIVIIALRAGGIMQRRLSAPVLVWLGERSYSLFLVHYSCFYLANHVAAFLVPGRDARYFVLSRVSGLSLAVLLAMILFTTVERRFARGLLTAHAFWPWQARRALIAHAASPGEATTLLPSAAPHPTAPPP